jgi:hypothetical protein
MTTVRVEGQAITIPDGWVLVTGPSQPGDKYLLIYRNGRRCWRRLREWQSGVDASVFRFALIRQSIDS